MNITNEEDTEEVDDDKDQIEDNHTNLFIGHFDFTASSVGSTWIHS
jgi:hypothetical protein